MMEKVTKFNKYSSQSMKGIAILMMLLHHNFLSSARFKGYEVIFKPFTQLQVVHISAFFKICVPIFAIISGYGLYLNYKKTKLTPGKWAASRSVKTMAGFWFVWVLAVVISQPLFGHVKKRLFTKGTPLLTGIAYMIADFLGIAKLIETPSLNDTWWYMSAALVFIVLVPLIMKFDDCLGIMLVFVDIAPRLMLAKVPGQTEILAFLPAFVLGMCCAKYQIFERLFLVWNDGIKHIFKFVLEAVAIVVLYMFTFATKGTNFSELRWVLTPFVIIAFCAEFISVIPVIKQILLFLGKHSMNIFMTHTFLRQYFYKDFIYSFKYFWLITLVLLICSIAISIVLEFLKKITKYNCLMDRLCEKIENC